MARVFVIRNARAGLGFALGAETTERLLRQRGVSVDGVVTQSLGELDTVVAQAGLNGGGGDYDAVIAAGGDGTVRALAERLTTDAPPLAALAQGGANYFARELGSPRDPARFVDMVLSGATAEVTLGRAHDAAFVLMAGVGVDGQAAAGTPHPVKRVSARAAYSLAVAGAAARHIAKAEPLQLDIDGVATEAGWIMVTNARFRPSRLRLPAGAAPHFHAILVRARGPLDVAEVLLRLVTGRLGAAPAVEVRRCESVTVLGPERLPVHGDGEVIEATPVTLRADRALRVAASI